MGRKNVYRDEIITRLISEAKGKSYSEIVRDIAEALGKPNIKQANLKGSVDSLIEKGILGKDNTQGENKTILKFQWTRKSLTEILRYNYGVNENILHSNEEAVNAAIEGFKNFDDSTLQLIRNIVKRYLPLFNALLISDLWELQDKHLVIPLLLNVIQNHKTGLGNLCLIYQLFSSLKIEKDTEYHEYLQELSSKIHEYYKRGQQHKNLDPEINLIAEKIKEISGEIESYRDNPTIYRNLSQLLSDFCNAYRYYFNNPSDNQMCSRLEETYGKIRQTILSDPRCNRWGERLEYIL